MRLPNMLCTTQKRTAELEEELEDTKARAEHHSHDSETAWAEVGRLVVASHNPCSRTALHTPCRMQLPRPLLSSLLP